MTYKRVVTVVRSRAASETRRRGPRRGRADREERETNTKHRSVGVGIVALLLAGSGLAWSQMNSGQNANHGRMGGLATQMDQVAPHMQQIVERTQAFLDDSNGEARFAEPVFAEPVFTEAVFLTGVKFPAPAPPAEAPRRRIRPESRRSRPPDPIEYHDFRRPFRATSDVERFMRFPHCRESWGARRARTRGHASPGERPGEPAWPRGFGGKSQGG